MTDTFTGSIEHYSMTSGIKRHVFVPDDWPTGIDVTVVRGTAPAGMVPDGNGGAYGPGRCVPDGWQWRTMVGTDAWRDKHAWACNNIVQARPAPEPQPEPGNWVIQVTVPSNVPRRDELFTAIADAATDWEPEDRDGWDIDVSAGPEADMVLAGDNPTDTTDDGPERARQLIDDVTAEHARTWTKTGLPDWFTYEAWGELVAAVRNHHTPTAEGQQG